MIEEAKLWLRSMERGQLKESIRTTLNVWIVEKAWPSCIVRGLAVIEWHLRGQA